MLIYRTMFEVASHGFATGTAATRFEDWLAKKLRRDHDPSSGQLERDGTQFEWSIVSDSNDTAAAYRGRLHQDRGNEQVRLTFSAVSPSTDDAVAWIDVERWTADQFTPGWIPYAPLLVDDVLAESPCSIGGIRLPGGAEVVSRDAVDDLLRQLFDTARTVPIVVVSPTKAERDDDISPTMARASELHRRLAGVAVVVTLGPGATSALSQGMHDAVSSSFDVHSGAVRTYLPDLGRAGDQPRRHRLVPYHRIEGRPAETAARLVSLPLVQASCLQPAPAAWEHAAQLNAFAAVPGSDHELEDLLVIAEQERDDALAAEAEARERRAEDRETNDELLAAVDALERRVAYLEAELTKQDPSALYGRSAGEVFEPDWCEEVAQRIADLSHVVTTAGTAESAGELDVHADSASWARKSWRALRALEAYAEEKLAGKAEGWDFKLWCEHSGSSAAIPASWVAMHESGSTETNPRFRRLRTLPVDLRVDAAGTVYMPAHIKIEKGGTPCPRIHFYDDLDGATTKMHVGWFGDHLDSAAKS